MIVLVTGANSQLGKCLQDLYNNSMEYIPNFKDSWYFLDHSTLDITNEKQIEEVFCKYMPNVIVNCAAYTNVEKAEDEFLKCNKVNCIGVENLLEACMKYKAFLITISTDYVYKFPNSLTLNMIKDQSIGNKYILENFALDEEDELDPQSNYALSKYLMESICKKCKGNMVIRTSWLYSQYGKNFLKTIVNKIQSNEALNVIDDQIGRPTNANKLAEFIMHGIICNRHFDINDNCEIYNFQENGKPASWFDFACKILSIWNNDIANVNNNYSTSTIENSFTSQTNYKAKRPYYSVMDITKAQGIMSIDSWDHSLQKLMIKTYVN